MKISYYEINNTLTMFTPFFQINQTLTFKLTTVSGNDTILE